MNTTIPRPAFAYFERKLRARHEALHAEIGGTLLRTDSEQYARIAGDVHDAEEDALTDLLLEVSLAEITRDVEEIRDIEAALGRIRAGTFGVCVRCREPIDRERLEAYATAKRCLACQQAHDKARAVALPPSL